MYSAKTYFQKCTNHFLFIGYEYLTTKSIPSRNFRNTYDPYNSHKFFDILFYLTNNFIMCLLITNHNNMSPI